MRVLVTGGAGFIGSHLVERLAREHPGSVTVLDNLRRGRIENLEACWGQINFIQADIRDRDALMAAMQGTQVVFHLAAQSNVLDAVRDIGYSFSTNVVGTFNVLDAAHTCGVRRLVFTSSREVYGEAEEVPVPESAALRPKNAYGASKVAGELYCRVFAEQGLETVILRLANVYGPRDRGRVVPNFIVKAVMNEPLTLYGGDQVLDFVWIETAIEALVKAGRANAIREPLNIGSGNGTRIRELAQHILRVTNSCSRLHFVDSRPAEVSRFVADSTAANRLLGLGENSELPVHLRALAEWMRAQLVRRAPAAG